MRYIYPDKTLTVNISPTPSEPTDVIQEIVQRRTEVQKKRAKLNLTETDCKLLCTNAKELKFNSGQVIAAEGDPIQAVYRIKCGTVSLLKAGLKLYDLTTGFFIGEGLFISGSHVKDVFAITLVASGPVILSEINLPFAKQLLVVDKELAFKVYRHIARKLSALLLSVIPVDSFLSLSRGRSDSDALDRFSRNSNSNSDIGSDAITNSLAFVSPILSPNFSHTESEFALSPKMGNLTGEISSTRPRRNSGGLKCMVKEKLANKDRSFKRYQLFERNAGGQAKLYSTKVVITNASKLLPKRTIKYNKILDLAKAAQNSITIIYGVQAKTLFFKDEAEAEEFFGLVRSFVIALADSLPPTAPPRSPSLIHTAQPITNDTHDDTHHDTADRHEFVNMASRHEFRQGDVVVAEGDLFQRVYTVVSGQLQMKRGDHVLLTMEEGDVFGLVTLFHLRPYIISIEVASPTATLLMIPAYKFLDLVNTNFPLAVRMHKKAAQVVYAQIERILMTREKVVKGYSQFL